MTAPASSLTHALRALGQKVRQMSAEFREHGAAEKDGDEYECGHSAASLGAHVSMDWIADELDALLRQREGTEPIVRLPDAAQSVLNQMVARSDYEGTEPAPTPSAHVPGNRIPAHEQIPSLFEVQEGGYWIIKARCECGASDEWRQFTPTLATEWHAEHKATVYGEPVAAPPTPESRE